MTENRQIDPLLPPPSQNASTTAMPSPNSTPNPVRDDQAERLARLAARRSATTGPAATSDTPTAARRKSKRAHPARGSRIAAAGVGATAMFGLVTLMGLDSGFTSAGAATLQPADPQSALTAAPQAPVVQPVTIVIHRTPATTSPDHVVLDEVTVTTPTPAPATAAPETVVVNSPVELTATPVVRTVTITEPTATRAPATSSTPTPAAAPTPAPAPAPATTKGSG